MADPERSCRICLAEDTREEIEKENALINPCNCSGGSRWIHRQCLDDWRFNCGLLGEQFWRCEICHANYVFQDPLINAAKTEEQLLTNMGDEMAAALVPSDRWVALVLTVTLLFLGWLWWLPIVLFAISKGMQHIIPIFFRCGGKLLREPEKNLWSIALFCCGFCLIWLLVPSQVVNTAWENFKRSHMQHARIVDRAGNR